jgi:hypothetical protein
LWGGQDTCELPVSLGAVAAPAQMSGEAWALDLARGRWQVRFELFRIVFDFFRIFILNCFRIVPNSNSRGEHALQPLPASSSFRFGHACVFVAASRAMLCYGGRVLEAEVRFRRCRFSPYRRVRISGIRGAEGYDTGSLYKHTLIVK